MSAQPTPFRRGIEMDYSRKDRADRLAAEYVLGGLRGGARRRLEALLPAHPTLRSAIAEWQGRLAPLTSSVPPIDPPPQVWQRIEAQLFATTSSVKQAWWHSLRLWQGSVALSSAAALVMLVTVLQQVPAGAPVIVVLENTGVTAPIQPARFVAGLSGDGDALVVQSLQEIALEADRSLELWLLPKIGTPQSLGLMKPGASTRVLRAGLLRSGQGLAVSVEPLGGSTTGQPTGPIVAMGKFSL